MIDRFLEEVEKRIGSDRVARDKQLVYAYGRDYWPLKLYEELIDHEITYPYAVVSPHTEDEVLEIVNIANEYRVRLVPYSGGSGVLGGILPKERDVVINLGRLNWIRWFDEKSRIIEVGSGVLMIELERWLNNRGYTLRHYPQSMPNAMIGGLVSTRSTGQYSTGYGGIENFVKGLHIVIPNTGLLKIPPLPRRSVLIPLENLFIGGEGIYGIVTNVYLEVTEKPNYRIGFAFKTESFKESIDKSYRIMRNRVYPELYRILDEYETIFHYPELGWGSLNIGCFEGYIEDILYHKLKYVEEVYNGENIEDYFWRWYKTRNDVIKWIYELYKNGLGFDTIEISSRWSNVLDIYQKVREKTLEINGVETVTGHIGHFYGSGVGLYFTFTLRLDKIREIYYKLWDTVLKTTHSLGGGISHHHGIGEIRMKYLTLEYGEEGLKTLEKIKNALDPNGILRKLI